MFKGLAKSVYEWCIDHGYDPFVVAALIPLFFLFLQRKDISNLRKVDPHWRYMLIVEIIFAAFMVVVAIAEVAGLTPKR